MINEEEKEKKAKNKGVTEENIQQMVDKACISTEQKVELKQLLMKYQSIFANSLSQEYQGGNSFFTPHTIRLEPNTGALWTNQFRLGHKEEQAIWEMNDKQIKAGIVEDSITGEYNSPVIFRHLTCFSIFNCFSLAISISFLFLSLLSLYLLSPLLLFLWAFLCDFFFPHPIPPLPRR